MYKLAIGITFGVLLFSNTAMAQCSSYPYPLTNGTTASGSQVMSNFNCAALTSGATINSVSFTGNNAMRSPGSASDPLVINYHSNALAIEFREDMGSYLKEYLYDHTGTTTNIFLEGEGPSYFMNSLGVGTSTGGGWNGNAELEAATSVSGYSLSGYTTYTGGSGGGALLLRINSTGVNLASFIYNGSGVGTITSNGTTTSYNTTSDERLKNWHIPQQDYEKAIRQIWVGDFAWKNTGRLSFGIRAQQAYAFFPEAIHKPANENNENWQADYGRLAPLALWGVKDLYKVTDNQNDRIAAIARQMKALAGEVVALRQANGNQAAQIRDFRAEIGSLQRKIRIQTAER